MTVQRICSGKRVARKQARGAIGLRPIAFLAAVWPEVLATIHACNIRSYAIFRHGTTLFTYFAYGGDDVEADLAIMAAAPKTQDWWALCKPMQEPLPDRAEGEWWATITEVFRTD